MRESARNGSDRCVWTQVDYRLWILKTFSSSSFILMLTENFSGGCSENVHTVHFYVSHVRRYIIMIAWNSLHHCHVYQIKENNLE